MKNKISILIIFALYTSFAFAQEKLSGPFQLSVKVPPKSKAYKFYLSYNNPEGRKIQDSAIAVNGQASFKGTLILPRLAQLELSKKRTIKEKNQSILQLNPHNIVGEFTFFLEPGQISIYTVKDSLALAMISGGPVNDDFSQFNQMLDRANKPIQDLSKQYYALDSTNHTEQNRMIAEITKLSNNIPEKLHKPFILNHVDRYVGLYVLSQYISDDMDPNVVESLLNKFSQKYQQTPLGQYIKNKIKIARITYLGAKAIDIQQPDTAGNTIKLSSLKGKYVLLDFWASWCMPCRMENPNLLKAYQLFKKDNFTILSVSIDTKRDNWLAAVHKDQLPWLQVSDLKVYNEAAMAYDVTSIPQNYLIDPQGIIIAKNLRGEALEKELEKIFKTNISKQN